MCLSVSQYFVKLLPFHCPAKMLTFDVVEKPLKQLLHVDVSLTKTVTTCDLVLQSKHNKPIVQWHTNRWEIKYTSI